MGADAPGAGKAAAGALRHRPAGRTTARDRGTRSRPRAVRPTARTSSTWPAAESQLMVRRDRSARRRAARAASPARAVRSSLPTAAGSDSSPERAASSRKCRSRAGRPSRCAATHGRPRGASWGPDDTIVFATSDRAAGCSACPPPAASRPVLTTPDAAHGEADHRLPVDPAGRPGGPVHDHGAAADRRRRRSRCWISTTGQRKTLMRGGSQAEYVRAGLSACTRSRARCARCASIRSRLDVVERSGARSSSRSATLRDRGGASSASRGRARWCMSRAAATGATRSLVWVNATGHERPHQPRRRAPTSSRGSRPTARAWRSTFAIRRTTSGSGISRARR